MLTSVQSPQPVAKSPLHMPPKETINKRQYKITQPTRGTPISKAAEFDGLLSSAILRNIKAPWSNSPQVVTLL